MEKKRCIWIQKNNQNLSFEDGLEMKKGTYTEESEFWSMFNYYPIDGKSRGIFQENYVFVENMETDNVAFKGIGSALLQIAIELAQKPKYQGRVKLMAVRNSHVFYHKMSFKSYEHDFNKKILELVKNPPKEYEDSGATFMYLDKEAIALWKEKTKSHPILNKSKSEI